ncbi:aldo/keto reductase [Solicola gregarius]|uniref:Aldo/keto reductase n=1 Tax=Solicola gregarius TaxID=2908642 RepID=A0AA46YN55_9ACTN|nr:aldo/keto reductase [Solicola gregarius]UYM07259.1 aldo/keto reductase [Solicola gregarius]
MRYSTLGRSGLAVSRLGLGTMNFGPVTDEAAAHHILDRAREHGINLVDTADVYGAHATKQVYGNEPEKGLSEEIVGRWLAQDAGRRDEIVLSTKVYGAMGVGPNDIYLSAKHIRQACDASLRRLGTDYLDLYLLHHIDRRTPWDEIWEALSILRAQGKVLYFGTSNHAAWQLVQGQETARRLGQFGFVAEQSIYNLKERTLELEVLPACRAYGIAVMPYSSLHGGLLSGVLAKHDVNRSASGRAAAGLADDLEQVELYERFCGKLGHHPAQVALSWLLHQDGVATLPLGIRTVEQLDNSIGAIDIALDDSALSELDDIFPGPGGPAPEAYAW